MSFEEKLTWVNTVVAVVVAGVYFWIVLGQTGDTPVAEIAYQRTLIIAVGASIVLTIIGAIMTAIGTAVGTAIRAEVTGEGSVDDIEIESADERDKSIGRRGDLVGMYVSSAGAVGVMALIMLEYEYFWIANALYLSFVIGSLVGSAVKLTAYRRGF
jgi:hypothetical protein